MGRYGLKLVAVCHHLHPLHENIEFITGIPGNACMFQKAVQQARDFCMLKDFFCIQVVLWWPPLLVHVSSSSCSGAADDMILFLLVLAWHSAYSTLY